MSPFIKKTLLFLPILCVITFIMIKKWREYDKTQQEMAQRQQYLQSLACVPKQAIDKKTLFANVMKQYWEYEIKSLWEQDKIIDEGSPAGLELMKLSCGLEEPYRMTQETCYPWQVPYQNLEELYSGLMQKPAPYQYNKTQNRFTRRMLSLNDKAYHPEKDENIYLNSDNHFSIIKRDLNDTLFYPADCCQLYSYDEMEKNHLLDEVIFEVDKQDIDKQLLENLLFLKVQYHDVDSCQYDRGRDGCIGANLDFYSKYTREEFFNTWKILEKHTVYYPVSQCGNLAVLQPSF